MGSEMCIRDSSYASRRGTRIAVVFSDGFIVDVFGEPLREAVKYADLVMANYTEASKFTGEEEEEKIVEKLKTSAPNFVLTKGDQGARIHFEGQDVEIPAVSTTAVDETGAGDMFAGAFLYGITNGLKVDEAGNLASKLASQIVSQLGPRFKGDLKAHLG